ncbi:peptidoglycan DD-metalloendopeptidase family protein [Roseivirga sp.]|uniref:peptidoglycan DD-metalloendopeptidase family protein n=1 Tax=Roseivirga sp. TaxID=1964215 RepID=UPI003B8C2C43
MSKRLVTVIGVSLIAIFTLVYFLSPSSSPFDDKEVFSEESLAEETLDDTPLFKFGIPVDLFELKEGRIKRNQTFADILLPYNVSRQDIFNMDKISRDVFSVRSLVVNKKYTIFYNSDSTKKASYFVYEPNDLEYVVYQLVDSLGVFRESRDVEIVERTMAGVISETLDHSIRAEGGSPALVNAMADIFGWQIDPKTLRKGDWFKIIYEDRLVEGKSVGIGKIISAQFNHIKNDYMAYGYDMGDGHEYFDESGESVQKAFLRYPVAFTRISSQYNPNRYLKMYGRYKPHLGTDFAASKNTPIKAAADGVIVARGFTRPNGNYIKIKHNGTYTTGYLHMNRFGKFKLGQRVKKGQTIGYVGSTGSSTGNHLCFRFWKRGKQVDFLKEKLPAEKPLPAGELVRFDALMSLMDKRLEDIPNTWSDKSVSASNE